MRYILAFFALFFLQACASYQEADINQMEGTWEITSVEAGGQVLFSNFGEVVINKNGEGTMTLKHAQYDESLPPLKLAFYVITSNGQDLHIDLMSLREVNDSGKDLRFTCGRDNAVSVRQPIRRRGKRTWVFDGLTMTIYPCWLSAPWLEVRELTWTLKKK
jgi:hypothetical protein